MGDDLTNPDSDVLQELSQAQELILWRELAVDTFCVHRGTEFDFLLREAVYHGWEATLGVC